MIFHSYKWGFWLRAKSGRGISISINRVRLFSERNGFIKVYRLGPIALQFLGVYR